MVPYEQRTEKPRSRNDVYTGLLAVSLFGMLIGCTLLYLDYRQYEDIKPPKPPLTARPDATAAPRVEPPPKADAGKKEEVKKEEPKKEEMKKEEMKKDDAKKDAKKDDAKKE